MLGADLPDMSHGDGLGEYLGVASKLIAVGLRRALARSHELNESLNPREGLPGVDVGDQARISADAPANGAKETA